jgi:hypothetical protein
VCTIATYGSGITYVNRFVAVRDSPVSLPETCFSSCFACSGGVVVVADTTMTQAVAVQVAQPT